MALTKDYAPRQDGIPFEFFQDNHDDIKKKLLEFVNKVLTSGRLKASLNNSKICLLPKTCNLTLISNYRWISLLGVPYKIIAKLIANRMIQFLPM